MSGFGKYLSIVGRQQEVQQIHWIGWAAGVECKTSLGFKLTYK